MASDRQQFARMEARYHELRRERHFSVPPDVGRMAVVSMYDPEVLGNDDFLPDGVSRRPADRVDAMDNEARRIKRYLERRGKPTVYLREASVGQFEDVLNDPSISDMTLIAAAFLTKVRPRPWTRSGSPDTERLFFGYYDAVAPSGGSPTLTHLKLGAFFHRSCGTMNRFPINVPFAWGFMADRSAIWAPVGRGFYPSRLHARPRAGLDNVAEYFGLSSDELCLPMDYDRAKEIFGRRTNVRVRRYPVPSALRPAYDRLRDNERVVGVHTTIRRRLSDWGVIWY